MGDRLGWFVTLSAYGNRLHGDERGTVDRRHNEFDSTTIPPNPGLAEWERQRMRGGAITFDAAKRSVIEAAIADVCEVRGWVLVACHCRTNHLHAVLGSSDDAPRVLHSLKAYGTRALREAGLIPPDQPVWSRHGSTRPLFSEEDIAAAAVYTMDRQSADLPGTAAKEWHRLI